MFWSLCSSAQSFHLWIIHTVSRFQPGRGLIKVAIFCSPTCKASWFPALHIHPFLTKQEVWASLQAWFQNCEFFSMIVSVTYIGLMLHPLTAFSPVGKTTSQLKLWRQDGPFVSKPDKCWQKNHHQNDKQVLCCKCLLTHPPDEFKFALFLDSPPNVEKSAQCFTFVPIELLTSCFVFNPCW